MEYEHIDRIQRDDLFAVLQRYFFPANMMLAVQGDFKTDEMRAKLEKLFGTWNYKQETVPPFPQVPQRSSPGVYLGVKNDVTQTSFALGHLGGILKDPNFAALSVMSDILGGGFSSRSVSVRSAPAKASRTPSAAAGARTTITPDCSRSAAARSRPRPSMRSKRP
jgi:predicted Zn-dependent peptidase